MRKMLCSGKLGPCFSPELESDTIVEVRVIQKERVYRYRYYFNADLAAFPKDIRSSMLDYAFFASLVGVERYL